MNSRINLSVSAITLALTAFVLPSCGLTTRIRSRESVAYPSGIRETRLELSARYDKFLEIFYGWPDSAPAPATLDTSVPWHIELLEQSGGIREKLRWESQRELLRVSIQGRTVFDASVCEVHHLSMDRVVETKDKFAGRRMPHSFNQARRTRFPNSGTEFPVCIYWEIPTSLGVAPSVLRQQESGAESMRQMRPCFEVMRGNRRQRI